jgi:lipopolysaccharide transport system permease protein
VDEKLEDASSDREWDIIIEARSNALHLPLHEIWQYRDLLFLLVQRDFTSFYRQTVLGPIWFVAQPLLTTLIFYFVFGRIAGLSTDGLPGFVFYLSGITFWNYFSDCFIKTSEVFISNAQLFGKVYFPRLIVPLAIVISNLTRFAIQFLLLLILWSWYLFEGAIRPQWTILLIPFLILLMAAIGLGVGIFFAAITTKYRDLRFLIQFGVQLMLYVTPIIYPLSMTTGALRDLVSWNPLAPIFETFRHGFLGEGIFSVTHLAWSTAFAIAACAIGITVYNRTERTFLDTV